MRPLRIVRPPRPGGAGGSSAGSAQSALWFIVLTAQILKAQTLNIAFLSRVSILTRDIDIANLPVCLSVRP